MVSAAHLAIGIGLVLSNVALIPVIFLSAAYLYLVDFFYLSGLFTVSTVYHLCQAGFWCAGPLELLQQADHVTVWSTLFWLYLTTLDFDIRVLFGIQVAVERLFIMFAFLFIDSSIFPYTFLVAGLFGIFLKVFYFKIPFLQYDVLFGATGLALFGIGLWFHLTAGPIDSEGYAWRHIIWHTLAMTAAFFLYLVRLGFSSLRMLHVDKKVAELRHIMRLRLSAFWNGGYTTSDAQELEQFDLFKTK